MGQPHPGRGDRLSLDTFALMPFPLRLSRVAAIALGPVVLSQGRRVRRSVPGLPDAALPWTGMALGDDPVKLLVLGDSTAAGVGADTQEDALPGALARALSNEWERGVVWRAIGENGATTRDLARRYLEAASAEAYDLVFLTIGANDALGLRSRRAFRRDLATIVRRLRAVNPTALILMACMPGFAQFTLLPNPLRWALGLHARSLEQVGRAFIRSEPGVLMSPPAPEYTEGFFASDLFHPSPSGYRDWVDFTLTSTGLVRPSA